MCDTPSSRRRLSTPPPHCEPPPCGVGSRTALAMQVFAPRPRSQRNGVLKRRPPSAADWRGATPISPMTPATRAAGPILGSVARAADGRNSRLFNELARSPDRGQESAAMSGSGPSRNEGNKSSDQAVSPAACTTSVPSVTIVLALSLDRGEPWSMNLARPHTRPGFDPPFRPAFMIAPARERQAARAAGGVTWKR